MILFRFQIITASCERSLNSQPFVLNKKFMRALTRKEDLQLFCRDVVI